MKPKISVVVPAYNNAPWLPRCLDSILAQTYSNLEILVVDDGSSDDTLIVSQEYAALDNRIRSIHKQNGGVTSARLRGVSEATGEWVGFVDADDYIEPQMYERLLTNALTYEADISHCGQRMIYSDGYEVLYYGSGVLRQQDRKTALRDLLEEKLVEPGLCNKLFRRELFSGIEARMPYHIRNNEDMLMNFLLFDKVEKAVFEDICPYHYLIREGSASRRKMNEHTIYDPIRVRQIILESCEEDLKKDAICALVSTSLFVYAQLCRGMEREYANERKKIRGIIRGQLKYTWLLEPKYIVMVWMVSCFPWLFHIVYGVYFYIKNRKRYLAN